MIRLRERRSQLLVVQSLLFLFPAVAAAEGEEAPVVEKLQHGEINWTDKTIRATGSGAPNLSLPNVAAVRLNAERAAQLAAYRNIVEALKGVRVNASTLGGDQLGQPKVRAQVEGIIKGCKTIDTRYFSDYGVDVEVRCALDGALAELIAPPKGFKSMETAGDKSYTGLVIDAVGLRAKPAIAPRVLKGAEDLYSQEMVKPSFLKRHGPVAYFRSIEAAKKSNRVGDKPLVLKATSVGESGSDLQIGGEEAAKLDGINPWFMTEGRVALVTDG